MYDAELKNSLFTAFRFDGRPGDRFTVRPTARRRGTSCRWAQRSWASAKPSTVERVLTLVGALTACVAYARQVAPVQHEQQAWVLEVWPTPRLCQAEGAVRPRGSSRCSCPKLPGTRMQQGTL